MVRRSAKSQSIKTFGEVNKSYSEYSVWFCALLNMLSDVLLSVEFYVEGL